MKHTANDFKYRPDIDGLRAIAVLAVVAFHTYPVHMSGGFIGVDVFFVISGYLISSIIFKHLDQGNFSFRDFYAKRIRRIFPALILVLISTFAFAMFALLANELKLLGKHTLAGAAFISNFALLQESGYFDASSETKPLLHLWSLSIEEQFYILWPLILWGIWKLKRNAISIAFVIVSLILASFYLNTIQVSEDQTYTFYVPLTRFWELLSGCLLSSILLRCDIQNTHAASNETSWEILLKENWPVIANIMSITGLSLLAFSLFKIHKGLAFPGYWALLPVMSAILIISAGPKTLLNKLLLANPVMIWFGRISFPLYLWHWPLVSFLWILESGKPTSPERIAAITLSILLAWLTYRFIEKPLRFNRSQKTVPSLSFAMVLIGTTGMIAYQNEGFPNRAILANISEVNAGLEFLESDNPLLHHRCLKTYGLSEQVRFCNNSLPDKKAKIALIGDSHAKAMYEAVTAIPETKALGVVNLGGRLFVDIASYPPKGGPEVTAYKGGIEATKLAARTKEIENVIMFSRGPAYFDKGINFELISNPSIKNRKIVWETGMRKTLDLFSHKKSIVFVIDNPDLDFEPRTCVAGRPLRINDYRKDCYIAKEQYLSRSSTYRHLVLSVLKDYPNVKVFDMANYFCDDQHCVAKKDGKVLYLDDNHLSLAGAELVANDLINLLLSPHSDMPKQAGAF